MCIYIYMYTYVHVHVFIHVQAAGGDLASKLELARVMNELDDQRRAHATQVCVCVCVCV